MGTYCGPDRTTKFAKQDHFQNGPWYNRSHTIQGGAVEAEAGGGVRSRSSWVLDYIRRYMRHLYCDVFIFIIMLNSYCLSFYLVRNDDNETIDKRCSIVLSAPALLGLAMMANMTRTIVDDGASLGICRKTR
jgi:hypothetical protein